MILPLSSDWDNVQYWLKHSGVHVIIILAVLLVAYVIFRSVFPRVARAAMMRGAHPPDEEMQRRSDTIIGVIDGSARIVALLLAVITVLPELGVDITATVTGLGIGGLALALGAQGVVKDAVNGIFLLAEDQYRTGDVVTIAEVTGTVEAISLRRTIIRDEDGVVHSVPNGSIGVVSNRTRDYARVNVDVRVSYGEDLAKVRGVVDQVAKAMSADAAVGELLMEPPHVKRVDSVGDTGVTITISARTRPAARWQIESELRQRLAEAFVQEKIHVPFPVYAPEAEKPAG